MQALNVRIAIAIKYFREKANLTQESLALRCGLDRTYISGIERFSRNITIKSLEKIIINGLDISTSTFFSYVEQLEDEL